MDFIPYLNKQELKDTGFGHQFPQVGNLSIVLKEAANGSWFSGDEKRARVRAVVTANDEEVCTVLSDSNGSSVASVLCQLYADCMIVVLCCNVIVQ